MLLPTTASADKLRLMFTFNDVTRATGLPSTIKAPFTAANTPLLFCGCEASKY